MSQSRPVSYGGEAVFDGVMMRGAHFWSLAVRQPDGTISIEIHPLSLWMKQAKRIPLIRGILALGASVVLGNRSLTASMRYREVDQKPASRKAKVGVALGVIAVLAVFLVVPALIGHFVAGAYGPWWLSTVEALARLAMIMGYIAALGLNKEVQDVFRYHSAEHAAISAREAGRTLSPAEVATFPNAHPRCGTAFLLLIILTGVVVHAFIGSHSPLVLALSRIAVLPIVAGLTYELIRFASLYSHSWFGRAMAAPGLSLQRLTTRTTTERHIEVAIAALDAVVEADANYSMAEVDLSKPVVASIAS